MKKILTTLGLVVAAAAPGNAQQVMCGAGGDVCVLSNFVLTNGGSTLQMYVFNGATAHSAGVQSRLMGVAVHLPDGFGYDGNFSATFFDYNGVIQTSGAAAFEPTYPATGLDPLWIDVAASGTGTNSIPTCAGPATPATVYPTCQRSAPTFGNQWDYMLFQWDIDGVMTTDDLALIGWGFRSQSIGDDEGGPGDGSLKCESELGLYNGGGQLCDLTVWDNPFDEPFETVPEPATMTLLATGLVGMAAARRRKSKKN